MSYYDIRMMLIRQEVTPETKLAYTQPLGELLKALLSYHGSKKVLFKLNYSAPAVRVELTVFPLGRGCSIH